MRFITFFIVVMVSHLAMSRAFAFVSGRTNLWRHSVGTNTNRVTAMHMSYAADKKASLVERLIDAKASSKLTFDEISTKLGITNAQTAQLFTNQAQLSPRAAALLKVAVPGISAADLATMQQVPMRSFDPEMMQVSDIPIVSLWYLTSLRYFLSIQKPPHIFF